MHVQVNQRYWLQLKRPIELHSIQHTFSVCLVPQYLPKEDYIENMGVLEHLMYASYQSQGPCIEEPPRLGTWPGIILRYQWPPNFSPPLPGYLYIHQQVRRGARSRHMCCLLPPGAPHHMPPTARGHKLTIHLWGTTLHVPVRPARSALGYHSQHEEGFLGVQAFEFDGVPKAWIQPMNTVADEVWVPSQYNAAIFRHDGVRKRQIQVITPTTAPVSSAHNTSHCGLAQAWPASSIRRSITHLQAAPL